MIYLFFLFVHENKDAALGVLTQQPRGYYQPIGYDSQQQASVAKGLHPRLQAVTATAMLCQTTEDSHGPPSQSLFPILWKPSLSSPFCGSLSKLSSHTTLFNKPFNFP